MSKKMLILASTLFLSLHAYSQIGITTPTPSSTLDVRGSIEGKYLEITGSYTLLGNDYHVSFSGTGNSNLYLPSKSATDNTSADFRGRKYYIKNNSTSAVLTLNAASGQILRLGGNAANNNTFDLRPGSSAVLTAGGANGWDLETKINWELYDLDFKGPVFAAVSLVNSDTTEHKLTDSQVTVIVPSSNAVVLLDFKGYGEATIPGGADAVGSITFTVRQEGPMTNYYPWGGRKAWYEYSGTGAPKFNFSVGQFISGLTPGTYTFYLTAQKEIITSTSTSSTVNIMGSTGRAEVYIK
ncbi:hypothetical protein [Chryseobacterium culicis]|uniref:hypothetical protein n=1 Tax=Chryseobacterium culicis TaxID=680127 RepID=UPI001876D9DA|nr:hypothetical protein [Chryseobacterium culicis]MBE4948454.1 hypothetical protein [Chryseobacterium culicis]